MKPTLNNIERNVSANIEELRNRVNHITENFNHNFKQEKITNNINDYNKTAHTSEDILIRHNNKNRGNNENIHTIAERLHEKLNEKEKKLNRLQMQTNLYMKDKKLFSPKSYYDSH